MKSCSFLFAMLLLSVSARAAAAEETTLTFERHVRPILKAHCFHCHGEDGSKEGSLDVRLQRLLLAGGDAGPSIVPGQPEESYLLDRLRDGEMPPEDVAIRPTAEEIETIARWIASGAKTARPEPERPEDLPKVLPEEREFWSFQPIRRPDVPAVKTADRVATPIDAFLLRRLEQHGQTFAAEADRRTLIRRASFDLLGLPPTPEQVEAFLADEAPGAWERLIDRLLASPRYGERWARHWLDVAGYADSEGYNETDSDRKYAWKYRDYVIRAFNQDKPFDRFIQEQLAGDEMVKPPYDALTAEEAELLAATGFLRMAPDGTGSRNDDPELARNEVVAETIKIVTSSLLGLTVACAQCHDHRFDPILHTDYYQIRAVFEPAYDWKKWRTPQQRLISLMSAEDRKRSQEIEQEAVEARKKYNVREQELMDLVFENEVTKIPEELRELARETRETPAAKRSAEQKKLFKDYPNLNVQGGGRLRLYLNVFPGGKEYLKELDELLARVEEIRAQKPPEDFIRALTEPPGHVPTTHLFHRGDFKQPAQTVVPAGLTVLYDGDSGKLPVDDSALPTTGRRLAFAKQLTDGTHPLVARVLVNRVWMHHFGQGLVATPGDFGTQGERPSHPELLDWLADEWMRGGWSLKQLHRLMMTSTAYRQSSRREPEKDRLDPDNRLYGRMPVRRLEAETVRDAVLAVSGQLDATPFGPAVPVVLGNDGEVIVGDEGATRRSVYIQVRRSQPLGLLETFDAPAMEPNCECRTVSTVAPQALALMNSQFLIVQSERFAERLLREAGSEPDAQLARLWQLAFTAEPTAAERAALQSFLAEQTQYYRQHPRKGVPPETQALANLCQVILGTNEFLYVD